MFGNQKILILDSEEESRKEICDIIYSLGVTVDNLLCCSTIEDALVTIDKEKVNLVIVEAADAIKQEYKICSLVDATDAQVFITANVNELGPIKTAAIRVHGIIQKPIMKEDIEHHLRIACRIEELNSKIKELHVHKVSCPDCELKVV